MSCPLDCGFCPPPGGSSSGSSSGGSTPPPPPPGYPPSGDISGLPPGVVIPGLNPPTGTTITCDNGGTYSIPSYPQWGNAGCDGGFAMNCYTSSGQRICQMICTNNYVPCTCGDCGGSCYVQGGYYGCSGGGSSSSGSSSSGGSVVNETDIGLRLYDGIEVISVAVEEAGTLTSPLRINKDDTVYGILLVSIYDVLASNFHIETSSGIMAIKKIN